MNKIWMYIITHKAMIAAYLIATILYSVYQFYPLLIQFVGFGLMMVFPSMWVFAAAPWIVAGMLCVAIAIIFWLANIRNNIVVSLLGFSVNYFIISLLTTVLEASIFIEIVLGVLMSYVIFMGIGRLMSKITTPRIPSLVVGAMCLGLSLYFAPVVTHPINAQRATAKTEDTFRRAIDAIGFIPYYPAYSSPIYPPSAAKLNGYDNVAYSNETVTFTLGNAEVKQGGYLRGQDKVMNFVDNCTIYLLWFALEDEGATIKQDDIDQSLEYPQKCELIKTTSTGKKVYFNDDGQWVRFYIKLDQTNLIIEFDNVNGREYDPNHLDEILKIIDSLQPLDKSKLVDGNSYGSGFSS